MQWAGRFGHLRVRDQGCFVCDKVVWVPYTRDAPVVSLHVVSCESARMCAAAAAAAVTRQYMVVEEL